MASSKSTSFFSKLPAVGVGVRAITSLRTPDGGTPTVSSEVTDYPPKERDPQNAKEGGNLKYPDKPNKTLTPSETSAKMILPLSPFQGGRGWITGNKAHYGWDSTSTTFALYAMADGVVLSPGTKPPYDPSGWPGALAAIRKAGRSVEDWDFENAILAEPYIKNCNGNVIRVKSDFDPPLLGIHKSITWMYLHMSTPTKWKEGDTIKKGNYVGEYGNTGFTNGAGAGDPKAGAHLHLDFFSDPMGSIDPQALCTALGIYP